jgi:hypothetical protein
VTPDDGRPHDTHRFFVGLAIATIINCAIILGLILIGSHVLGGPW